MYNLSINCLKTNKEKRKRKKEKGKRKKKGIASGDNGLPEGQVMTWCQLLQRK